MRDGRPDGVARRPGVPEIGGAPSPERRYDTFVVRLWRDGATGRLLRAEVEHAATGERARATGPAHTWILDRIRACLDAEGERAPPLAPEATRPANPR